MGTDNSHLECQSCYFSELIDGILFCNYCEEDVDLDSYCSNFVNVFRLKEIFVDVNEYLGLNNIIQDH